MVSVQKLRQYRIAGIAMFDLILAWLGLLLFFLLARSRYFQGLPTRNFILASLLLVIPTGILFHILFGVNTHLSYLLGLSYKPKPNP